MRAETSLAQFRDVDHGLGTAAALNRLARLARDAGDDRREASAHHEALQLCASIGDRWAVSGPLAGLGRIAAAHGQPEVAARRVGAVDALAQAAGTDIGVDNRENHDRAAAAARIALGEERFAAFCAAGRTLRLDEAIALAAMVAIPGAGHGQPGAQPTSPHKGALSAREQDVLRLAAAGRTDREIANALFLSPRTVNAHLRNMFRKADVTNRTELSVWGVAYGLVAGAAER
ncbi:MAG: helix-turn-helix domain-containing protein [Geminicoccales bacterium]